jgi:uncharacterized alkaline shock family protein YloU
MKIYSLVGKSGTGKSYQAIGLSSEKRIEYIIDDGLLIGGGAILAGRSAKRAGTKVGAIKTALFKDDGHRNEVVAKIIEEKPASILVIGTSDKMVTQICTRLGLPQPEERIYIEALTTRDERKLAWRHRHELGQHIIPAPTLEVKKEFSGYFLHPLRVLKDMREGRPEATERSVVRPPFSYLGNFTISDKAIVDIVEGAAAMAPAADSVESVFVSNKQTGIRVYAGLIVRSGNPVFKVAEDFQRSVKEAIEKMTAMNVLSVEIEIRGLMWEVRQ